MQHIRHSDLSSEFGQYNIEMTESLLVSAHLYMCVLDFFSCIVFFNGQIEPGQGEKNLDGFGCFISSLHSKCVHGMLMDKLLVSKT